MNLDPDRPPGADQEPPGREPPLPATAAYPLWAATYATEGTNPLTACAADLVHGLLPPLEGRRVLDAGCGLGRWAAVASSQGTSTAVGVDASLAMLTAGRDLGPARVRLPVAAADIRRLPFRPRAFDVILAVLVLGHVADPAVAVAELARVLAPGGALVLADMHPDAARRGWRRTFHDSDGQRREVAWVPHEAEALRGACVEAGLRVTATRAAAIAPADLPPGALGGPALLGILAGSPP